MGVQRIASMIKDQRIFLKEKSMINDHRVGGERKSRAALAAKTERMAREAMTKLDIPETYFKSVAWLAWNRSEARFYELIELAMRPGIEQPGRYFIASITQERKRFNR